MSKAELAAKIKSDGENPGPYTFTDYIGTMAYSARTEAHFAYYDTNKDGIITMKEMCDIINRYNGDPYACRSMFWRDDKNDDGKVTKAEYAKYN